MPSAEETTYLIEVMPDASQESFSSRDVDVLVSRIKENLRLSSLKSRSNLSHKVRSAPYRLRDYEDNCAGKNQQHQQQPARMRRRMKPKAYTRNLDTYERFEALLRTGALINEAVKRLQTNDDDEDEDDVVEEGIKEKKQTSTSATSTTLDSMDEDENDDEFFYRRKRFYYEDEDEPLVYPCSLDL